jgi:hypothetical protein
MFKRRHQPGGATPDHSRPGAIDRRRLMRLGGGAAVGAAVGIANGPTAGAAAPTRRGVVSMTTSRQTVTVPGGLSATSRVLATINSDPDELGFFPVVAAAPDPKTGTIKIQTNSLTAHPPYPEVAWFVFD